MALTEHLRFKLGMDAKGYHAALSRVRRVTGETVRYLGALTAGTAIFSVREALAFSKGMAEVSTLTQVSASELKRLKLETRAVAVEMGKGLGDTVKALYQTLSLGIPKGNAIEFMRVAGRAAIGGVTDMETAVVGLRGTMRIWGMEMSQLGDISDTFFTAIKDGKNTFESLSQNIAKFGPLAASLDVPIDEAVAAMTALTKQGRETSDASTELGAVLNALLKPSEEMKAAYKELEVAGAKELLTTTDLNGALEKLAGVVDHDTSKIGKMLGRRNALLGFLSLTGKSAKIAADTFAEFGNKAGSADAAFRKMTGDVSFQFAQMKVQIQSVAVAIGEEIVPALAKVGAEFTKAGLDSGAIEGLVEMFKLLAAAIGATAKGLKTLFEMGSWIGDKLNLGDVLLGPMVDAAAATQALGTGITARDVSVSKQLLGRQLGGKDALSQVDYSKRMLGQMTRLANVADDRMPPKGT